ncbi:hypothetical protein [Nocardia terpenica]|nr:hypothetical protein [Nocardia terpenica]
MLTWGCEGQLLSPRRNEPRDTVTDRNMQVKMSVVLFTAERGQNLATAVLVDNALHHILHDREQVRPEFRIQLQQRPDMTLRNHDHVIGAEPTNRRAEGKHMIGLGYNIDIDQPGNNLIAIPIRLRHNRLPYEKATAIHQPSRRSSDPA